ncbi:nucleotidyl transferase AbiEii/AbiGii toxin family protein [Spirochaetota bacterium]
MSLFDTIVNEALSKNEGITSLRPVIEKEILHLDILREMKSAGFLKALTFIGGTCLRACYGSVRLSEDLDFTGGSDFLKDDLADMGNALIKSLQVKYSLPVKVSKPKMETGNMQTWRVTLQTHPKRPDLPAQRISIDICAITSHQKRPVLFRNIYGIEAGISGLIINAETLEEIYADKIIAFTQRPNRVKNRDLWDIWWLDKKNISLSKELLLKKIDDRKLKANDFFQRLRERVDSLTNSQQEFLFEMRRFCHPLFSPPKQKNLSGGNIFFQ